MVRRPTRLTLFRHRKGLQFYSELFELTSKLLANTRKFVSARTVDRDALIAKLETERRYSAAQAQSPPPKPPLPPPPGPASRLPTSQAPVQNIESSFASMKIGATSPAQPPQAQQSQWHALGSYNSQPQPSRRPVSMQLPAPPAPPPNQYQAQNRDPYDSIGILDSQKIPASSPYVNGSSSQHQRSASAFPPRPPPPPEQPRHSYSSSGQYGFPPPPQQPFAQQYQPPTQQLYGAPPPLPAQYPPRRNSQYTVVPPPPPPPGQPNQGGNWPGFWQGHQPPTG